MIVKSIIKKYCDWIFNNVVSYLIPSYTSQYSQTPLSRMFLPIASPPRPSSLQPSLTTSAIRATCEGPPAMQSNPNIVQFYWQKCPNGLKRLMNATNYVVELDPGATNQKAASLSLNVFLLNGRCSLKKNRNLDSSSCLEKCSCKYTR